jgi:hypothetical protein
MNKADEDFLRHLHKQLAQDKKDDGITTIRALERQRKDKHKQPIARPNKSDKY